MLTFLHVTRAHVQPQVAQLFCLPPPMLSAPYKTGLFFKPTSEGRVHNVGQQIRTSCWLHIASDTPTDKQSYINFPNLHTEVLVSFSVSLSLSLPFLSVQEKLYSNIIFCWDS